MQAKVNFNIFSNLFCSNLFSTKYIDVMYSRRKKTFSLATVYNPCKNFNADSFKARAKFLKCVASTWNKI